MAYGGKNFGPFKSSLIPYTEELIKLRFIENKTYREIRILLKEKYNISVADSTVMDFLKVREKRKNPRQLNDNLKSYLNIENKKLYASNLKASLTLNDINMNNLRKRMLCEEYKIEKWNVVFNNGDIFPYEKVKQFVAGNTPAKLDKEGNEIFVPEDSIDSNKITRMSRQTYKELKHQFDSIKQAEPN